MSSTDTPIFHDLNAGDIPEVTEVESLCMNCHSQGITRLLLTRIPFFRDVIVSSFSCDDCGFENRQLDSAGSVADKGVRFTLTVTCKEDLNRQVVLCSGSQVRLPDLDSLFPCSEGVMTTVEGVLRRFADNLENRPPLHADADPRVAEQIRQFIVKFRAMINLEDKWSTGFTFVLDDHSGRSWLENPNAPATDPNLQVAYYVRTAAENETLGITEESHSNNEQNSESFDPQNEVVTFHVNCPECNAPAQSNMKLVDIPFFKEVVIMATNCDSCGHRDNEVKGGSGVEPLGRRMELLLTDKSDLSRDCLKSETCAVEIPELELETMSGTLGGRFTTVEGLLVAIRDQLKSVVMGDSVDPTRLANLEQWLSRLQEVIDGDRLQLHVVLDDPAGNSYLQNLFAPDPDPHLVVTEYQRSFQQNEDLGLNDMNTEEFSTSS